MAELQWQLHHPNPHMNTGDTIQIEVPDFNPDIGEVLPTAQHNKPTAQQAATQDPVSQQTHPLQPGKTRVYPSMLTNKQVLVLNLTETSITSQADLQDAFQSLCLCSHGGKESTEDKSTE